MSHLSVFFNTKVEDAGILAGIGDAGLTPFRYLFNGKTILADGVTIHHVASFHKLGHANCSRTYDDLKSSPTSMIKTALAILFLIPGLFFAPFKGLAYLFSDVREMHDLTLSHLTPQNRSAGTYTDLIKTEQALKKELDRQFNSDPYNKPTEAIIIYGDGELRINEDPGILRFNPLKLVLSGATIIPGGPLDKALCETGKWKVEKTSLHPKGTLTIHIVKVIEEALKAPPLIRDRFWGKEYHRVFQRSEKFPE